MRPDSTELAEAVPIALNACSMETTICYTHTIYLALVNANLKNVIFCNVNRGSYMSVHVLLNLLNKLRKRDKM